ncbi:MAG: YbjN domain-containing protein [Anaerolineae bacterium]|nr:YbjN domain-containing protein [Anaerolineae bacterium]
MSDDTPPNNTPPDREQRPESIHPNSLKAYTVLGAFLEQDGWHPQADEARHFYRMGFSGKNGEFRCFAQILANVQQIMFYAVAPMRVPEEVRPAVAEFITRANYGMRIGNFEMDYSDGEVRYKTSLDFEDAELTPPLIRNMIYPAVLTMDRYLPGLMSVVFGGRTPFEAIEEIEGRPADRREDS